MRSGQWVSLPAMGAMGVRSRRLWVSDLDVATRAQWLSRTAQVQRVCVPHRIWVSRVGHGCPVRSMIGSPHPSDAAHARPQGHGCPEENDRVPTRWVSIRTNGCPFQLWVGTGYGCPFEWCFMGVPKIMGVQARFVSGTFRLVPDLGLSPEPREDYAPYIAPGSRRSTATRARWPPRRLRRSGPSTSCTGCSTPAMPRRPDARAGPMRPCTRLAGRLRPPSRTPLRGCPVVGIRRRKAYG